MSAPVLRQKQKQDDACKDKAQAFPEQHGIAFDQRRRRGIWKILIGLPKIKDKFREFVITLGWIGMHGLLEHLINPCWDLAIAIERGSIFQFSLL